MTEDPKSIKFEFEHLVLRDHIIAICELDNIQGFEEKLTFLFENLKGHFTIKRAKNMSITM